MRVLLIVSITWSALVSTILTERIISALRAALQVHQPVLDPPGSSHGLTPVAAAAPGSGCAPLAARGCPTDAPRSGGCRGTTAPPRAPASPGRSSECERTGRAAGGFRAGSGYNRC